MQHCALKPQKQPPSALHERIPEETKAERKLRPVSPGEVHRAKLDDFSPYTGRRTSSTLSLANVSSLAEPSRSQSVPQRKTLLKAPSLAELDSSNSDDEFLGRTSASSSSLATSLMDDMSPELSKHGSLKSHNELELPPEMTEDWASMEVCVDCKKFIRVRVRVITDIIASSKHSLSLANKQARLKRKTQSFYLSSSKV
ncbi:Protein spire -like protein 1 [Takifugu flavidus]|uniref:Protein spire-like protein 1 n=1 Tax=Takifugu flavidus TaxID=433684 RepID=A0A5C6PBV9_9TELE|nr:Protein spire -like protein 1 [Takifugu flavidus]